ncbi:MAG: hypothetical protein H6830_12745 [Planctomycetes bacterium]|nr:hypothetical protein [Planctomycetota bacterium]MCB9911313.1 hypothetical protein [Planctomycetota bacterium]HPF15397.1 hypothetical protein [Planctomycetota bacterium]HRV80380.1 hypothetical protein [Planctomycetota bacterium]
MASWRDHFERLESALLAMLAGDPLGVRKQVISELSQRCLLLDPTWLTLRVMVAWVTDDKEPDPGELPERIRKAIDQALPAESRAIREQEVNPSEGSMPRGGPDPLAAVGQPNRLPSGTPSNAEEFAVPSSVAETIARPLGIEAGDLQAACMALNRLPWQDRKTFHALVLQRKPIEGVSGGSIPAVQRACESAQAALVSILHGLFLGPGSEPLVQAPSVS